MRLTITDYLPMPSDCFVATDERGYAHVLERCGMVPLGNAREYVGRSLSCDYLYPVHEWPLNPVWEAEGWRAE